MTSIAPSSPPRAGRNQQQVNISPLDWLLAAVPVAFAVRFVPSWKNDTLLFIISGLAIIPLAAWMGRATEEIGQRAGAGVGGLLNATFGNAAELIIALAALNQGLISLVKASITGSILGNLLLVLGASAVCGGARFRHQRFNVTAARVSATALTLAAIGLLVPTIFRVTSERLGDWTRQSEQGLSYAIAAILLVTYGFSLLFALVTHKELFSGESDASKSHEDAWPLWVSALVLAGATAVVAFMSEFLVHSVGSARLRLGLTERFVGIVIVAIIGNAAEHSTAVWMAMKNKMDLSLGIAIGSSIQVALFVTPVLVFAGAVLGRPITLEFTLPEIAAMALAIWIVGQMSGDGESNWMEGVQLLSVYLIVAVLFYFLPEPPAPAR